MHTNIKEINREKTHLLPPETEFAGVRVRGSWGVPWFLGLEGVAGEDAGLMVEMAVGVLLTLAVGEASWAWEVDSLDTEKCSDEGSKNYVVNELTISSVG